MFDVSCLMSDVRYLMLYVVIYIVLYIVYQLLWVVVDFVYWKAKMTLPNKINKGRTTKTSKKEAPNNNTQK